MIPERIVQTGIALWRRIALRPAHAALIVLGVLVVATSGSALHFYLRTRPGTDRTNTKASDERETLVRRVGQLIVLPDEQPEIATVTNPDALRSDPFFAQAKVGDKLLIFTKARRAILFDPVAGVIVNAAPLGAK